MHYPGADFLAGLVQQIYVSALHSSSLSSLSWGTLRRFDDAVGSGVGQYGTTVVLYTTGSSYFRGVFSVAVLVFAVHGSTPGWVTIVYVSERRSILEPEEVKSGARGQSAVGDASGQGCGGHIIVLLLRHSYYVCCC